MVVRLDHTTHRFENNHGFRDAYMVWAARKEHFLGSFSKHREGQMGAGGARPLKFTQEYLTHVNKHQAYEKMRVRRDLGVALLEIILESWPAAAGGHTEATTRCIRQYVRTVTDTRSNTHMFHIRSYTLTDTCK